jgi:histidinol-phosphate phosphatase family protein
MNKAIFLDKDGTLIHDVPFNVDPELIRLEDYALESLSLLQHQGFFLIVITNQPGISRGYFKEDALEKVEQKLNEILSQKNISLQGFYYCPHDEKDNCECRKPKAGLLLKAAKEMDIDLSESWMIGDILNDVEAGKRSGCQTILIDNGNETEWEYNDYRIPKYIAKNLKEAADLILT